MKTTPLWEQQILKQSPIGWKTEADRVGMVFPDHLEVILDFTQMATSNQGTATVLHRGKQVSQLSDTELKQLLDKMHLCYDDRFSQTFKAQLNLAQSQASPLPESLKSQLAETVIADLRVEPAVFHMTFTLSDQGCLQVDFKTVPTQATLTFPHTGPVEISPQYLQPLLQELMRKTVKNAEKIQQFNKITDLTNKFIDALVLLS